LVFHVQTEDSGVDNPHIFTHLFNGGVIVSTRKLVYDKTASEESVKSLMQAQHKAMLKDMKRGTFDSKIDEYFGSNPALLPADPSVRPRRDTENPEVANVEMPVAANSPAPAPAAPSPSPPAVAAATPAPVRTPAPVLAAQTPRSSPPISIPPPTPPAQPRVGLKPPTIPPIPKQGTVPNIAPPPANPATSRMGSRNQPKIDVSPEMEAALRAAALPPPNVPAAPGAVRDTFRTPAPQMAAPQAAGPDTTPATGEYVLVRKGGVEQHSEGFEPEAAAFNPQPQPPVPAIGRPSGKQRRIEPAPAVVVSRPAVVIGGAQNAGAPVGAARTRRTREDSRMLFGREIVSEKSLDEVILAYLGEEPPEE
jgi:hypothetical protein